MTPLPSLDDVLPSSSTVSLAYDAFHRMIRDAQAMTLNKGDGPATAPEFKMEYAWHDSGPLKKIVRKIADVRVTETTRDIDPSGNVTTILDQLLADSNGNNPLWVNDDPGDTRFIELNHNIDSTIDDITRSIGNDATGPDCGYTDFVYRSDSILASVLNRRNVGSYPISTSQAKTKVTGVFNDAIGQNDPRHLFWLNRMVIYFWPRLNDGGSVF